MNGHTCVYVCVLVYVCQWVYVREVSVCVCVCVCVCVWIAQFRYTGQCDLYLNRVDNPVKLQGLQ